MAGTSKPCLEYIIWNKNLMHVWHIIWLNRIVCVMMYISIVCFLDFISIINVCFIAQKCCCTLI
jgi:hypothetical protein